MITLHIDSSQRETIKVGLEHDEKIAWLNAQSKNTKAQIVLPLIDKLLKKYKFKISDISSIDVNTRPGSFTGVRVGVSIANALAYIAKIPVNGRKIGIFVTPRYE